MSCDCSGDYNSSDSYNGYCNADTPYPSISHESVPSLIDNLVNALYGAITKDVSSGKVVWNIPCDPNNTTEIANVPRYPNEGLLCYFIRVLDSAIGGGSGITPAISSYNLIGGQAWSLPYQITPNSTGFLAIGTTNQVLSVSSSGQIEWGNAVDANTPSTVVRRDALGSFYANRVYATLVGSVEGNALTATTSETATYAINAGFAASATTASYAVASGTADNATNAATATSATTANAVIPNGVLTSMIGDGQVIGSKLETISGLTAGTYGSATSIPVVTVDTKGRVSAISQVPQPTRTGASFFADSSYGDVGYNAFNGAGVFVDTNGMVRTIGTNIRFRLGQGSDNFNSNGIGFFVAQIPRATNENVTKIMVTNGSMFALTSTGNLYSCGANTASGSLGVGDNVDRPTFTKLAVFNNNVADFCVSTCGSDPDEVHGLAVTTTGQLYAWGRNSQGQLGDNTTTARPTPTLISGGAIAGKTITRCFAFGGGAGYSFVLDNQNNIYSTGINTSGQLGLGDTTNRTTFSQVSTLKASAIYATGGVNTSFTAASTFIVWQGNVWSTGDNTNGTLGVGDAINKSSFTSISGLSNVASLTTSNNYANQGATVAALLTDGTIRTWGRGTEGALGNGSNTNASTPQILSGVSGLTFSKIQYIGDPSSGGSNLIALTTTGLIYVCGFQGRIFGNGGPFNVNRNTLQPCRQPVNVVFTDFRAYGQCPNTLVYAESSTNELWAWGANGAWQTSTSYGTNVSMPQKAFLN
jgi:alpha-tubulin suppressor-like RCC1 family protein